MNNDYNNDQQYNQQYNQQQNSPYDHPYDQQQYYQQPYQQPYQQNAYYVQPGESQANTALVCGIISLFFAGLILGIIAVVQANSAKKMGYMGGKATAGMVLGILGIVGSLSISIFILPLIFALMA